MSANPSGTEQPIIIKKKKAAHAGHHGGAWKVAYADFVTAMMAFFLLLWLLNVTTSDQRKGIADYFAPSSVSKEQSGAGGVLGGKTVTAPGAQISATTAITAEVPAQGQPGLASTEVDDATDSSVDQTPRSAKQPQGQGQDQGAGPGQGQQAQTAGTAGAPPAAAMESVEIKSTESRLKYQDRLESMAKQLGIPGKRAGEALSDFADRIQDAQEKLVGQQGEARQFQQTVNDIRQAIQSIPEMQQLAEHLVIDQTPDGLRIQIVDQEQSSMFPGGSSQMYPQTRQLADLVGKALGKLPNKLSITGYTDATPFNKGAGRDNWDLSAERANAMRRALVAGGISEDRIQDVSGKADRDLLDPKNPTSAKNRRISIVLLREPKK